VKFCRKAYEDERGFQDERKKKKKKKKKEMTSGFPNSLFSLEKPVTEKRFDIYPKAS